MGNFFDRENMLARVIAFLIACALWMYVMNEQNPLVERNYVVNLELRNVPEGMIVLNTPDKVRVKVQAQRTVLGDITEKEVTAYVDFADSRPCLLKHSLIRGPCWKYIPIIFMLILILLQKR